MMIPDELMGTGLMDRVQHASLLAIASVERLARPDEARYMSFLRATDASVSPSSAHQIVRRELRARPE